MIRVRTSDVVAVQIKEGEEVVIEYTVKEFAAREQVSERQVRRWINDPKKKGALEVRKTAGGGVRIIVRIAERRKVARLTPS